MKSDIMDAVIALGTIALAMMVPIVVVMLKHQQKMAELYRTPPTQNLQQDDRVLKEIAELRQLVVQQTLAIDNLRSQQLPAPDGQSVQNRLGV